MQSIFRGSDVGIMPSAFIFTVVKMAKFNDFKQKRIFNFLFLSDDWLKSLISKVLKPELVTREKSFCHLAKTL